MKEQEFENIKAEIRKDEWLRWEQLVKSLNSDIEKKVEERIGKTQWKPAMKDVCTQVSVKPKKSSSKNKSRNVSKERSSVDRGTDLALLARPFSKFSTTLKREKDETSSEQRKSKQMKSKSRTRMKSDPEIMIQN